MARRAHVDTSTAYLRGLTETSFQQQVLDLAHIYGWHHNHTRRSIGKGKRWTTATSCVGWPDLELWNINQHRIIHAELKTETGKVSVEQALVLTELAEAGGHVHIWRPHDFDDITACLSGRCTTAMEAHRDSDGAADEDRMA